MTAWQRGAIHVPGEPPGPDEREFLDPDFVAWRVVERSCAGVPGARRERCLVFASAWAIRRVYEFPDHWRQLPVEALVALSRAR